MINQREISKWQFIFQFWKKVLTILLCTSILWGVVRALWIHFDLLAAIDDNIIAIGIPCVLACCMPCLIDKDTEPYLVFKITTFKHKTTESWDRLNGAIIMLICTIVLFNTNKLVEYSMRETVSVPTISQNNLSECIKADYIHVDQLAVHKEDVGRLDLSHSYTEKSEKYVATEVFDVAPLLYLPNVYVCKCRRGNDITPLIGVKFADLYLKHISSAAYLKQYRTAASFCITPLPEGTEIKDIIFLEVSSEFDATLGNHAWLYILGALLGGTLIWVLFFALVSKGPYYPIKSHPFFKKSLSSKLRITWLYIRHIFQSQILFIWYIPVISIIVAVIEIAQMGGLIVPNEEVGAATPMSVLENGEYWRLVSCVFVHGGIFHIFFELIFYISLANLCCQWYGCRVYKSRTLLLYIFYWIGTVAANYFTVKDGYTAIGVIGGEYTLAGLLFISFLTMPKKIREDNVLVLIGLLFFIGFWLFQIYIAHADYVNKALAPKRFVIIDEASYMSIKGVFLALICGIVFQLLLELYYWVKRKNEDKDGTQNYQKEYTTINQGE